jgi:thiol-disulfide isomerase/thioredoxin
MRIRGLARLLVCALIVTGARPGLAQTGATDFPAKLKDAETLMARRQFEDALRIFKDANGLRDKKSAEALLGMSRAYLGLRDAKKAVDTASDALKYAAGNAVLEANVRNARGLAHFALAVQKSDDKRWKQAEEDFRAAVSLSDQLVVARYNLGLALLKQVRDAEGIAELEGYLAAVPRGADAENARKYIANPRHARENFAPNFTITTLDGESLSLESLRGKIVLIDFWATWCGPCLAATPGLARLHKKFGGQPFVILGISADKSAENWRAFIESKKLTWAHYLDSKRMVADRFGVNGYPTYILLDHEGIIRYLKQGWSPQVDQELEHEARKLIKTIPAGSAQ